MNLFQISLPAILVVLIACNFNTERADRNSLDSNPTQVAPGTTRSSINPEGTTIATRFNTPEGFVRTEEERDSFQEYLREISLKPHGSDVHYYDGRIKAKTNVYDAVIDLEIGTKDLHQCADAIMRLRAEYLWSNGDFDEIHFNFTNGFRADYSKWREGYRIDVKGNSVSWVLTSKPSKSYESFWKYLETVFTYAGTLSLSKELKKVEGSEMQIGDVFIQGGSPGHAVIIVDMAESKETREKVFLLAQSYMPAQEIQILKNPNNSDFSPWYIMGEGTLKTPEWTFSWDDLKRFED